MPSMLVIDGQLVVIDGPAARTRGARLRSLADSLANAAIGSKRQKRSHTAEPPQSAQSSQAYAPAALPPACGSADVLFSLELKREPRPRLHLTAEQESLRSHCLEWMLAERKLLPETVHLGVALLDRCLERQLERMGHARGRLLAIASLHAAAKYEESRESVLHGMHESPQLREAVLSTECWMLNSIGWNLATVTPVAFLRRFLHDAELDGLSADGGYASSSIVQTPAPSAPSASSPATVERRAFLLLELALIPTAMARWRPSLQAAAALHVALKQLGLPRWTAELAAITSYSAAQLKDCEQEMSALHAEAGRRRAAKMIKDTLKAIKATTPATALQQPGAPPKKRAPRSALGSLGS